ncbi:MAG: hypothetical protein H8E76_00040 [Helicobacteraceae bacterium]|nr:hypothetical protein [Candidatus Sulfurimonas ponti]
MKNLKIITYLLIVTIFFSACSNMTIGFEEDSVFYTEPTVEKQKNQVTSQKASETVTKTEQEIKIEEEKQELPHKAKAFLQESLEFTPEEGTQMYYERDDGE